MKRRDFIKNVGAFGAIPALPSQFLAGSELPPEIYSRAAHLASIWVDTSANMMKNALNLDEKTAHSLFSDLIEKTTL